MKSSPRAFAEPRSRRDGKPEPPPPLLDKRVTPPFSAALPLRPHDPQIHPAKGPALGEQLLHPTFAAGAQAGGRWAHRRDAGSANSSPPPCPAEEAVPDALQGLPPRAPALQGLRFKKYPYFETFLLPFSWLYVLLLLQLCGRRGAGSSSGLSPLNQFAAKLVSNTLYL